VAGFAGGIFHDCAIHDIDMVCWLVGDTPASVYTAAHAHADDIRSVGDVDTVVITMKFRTGALATIDLSRYAAYGYDQRLEVCQSVCMSGSQRLRCAKTAELIEVLFGIEIPGDPLNIYWICVRCGCRGEGEFFLGKV